MCENIAVTTGGTKSAAAEGRRRSRSLRGRMREEPDASASRSPTMTHPFFTVGHSTRTIPEFVSLLGTGSVQLVIDIRTVPRSRTNPQYNKDVLPDRLEPFRIGYEHFPELGGLRKRSAGQRPELNGFWINQSFHNYADYATTEPFRLALDRLVSRGRERRLALMCSEAVWWRCHRRIVADYLLARGETVFHFMEEGRMEPATLTPGAIPQKDGTLLYPAAAPDSGGTRPS